MKNALLIQGVVRSLVLTVGTDVRTRSSPYRNHRWEGYPNLWKRTGREQNMILYELYWRDETGKEYFIGTLPERRTDPERITEESVLNWGKDFVGDGSDPKNIYFVRVRTQPPEK